MNRPDLLALTEESLATLANPGLVKRAARALGAGTAPALSTRDDGTVAAEFPDGVVATLPPDGFTAGRCDCAATGSCRHLVGLVLAYQAEHAAPAPPQIWSPAEFDDEALAAALGSRAMSAARRTLRTGYSARVRRGPVPAVELPATTIRFLAPHRLGYVHSDAAGEPGPALALAVWACRAADRLDATAESLDIQVDAGLLAPASASSTVDRAALAVAPVVRELATELLSTGAVHAGTGRSAAVVLARRRLAAARHRWPLLAVEELADQLDAYQRRHAAYRPVRFAEILAELVARYRAAARPPSALGTPRSLVLGSDEAARTPLRHLRLTALGARVETIADRIEVRILLADPPTGTVLVLRNDWPDPPETDRLTGPALAGRRLAGSTVRALATGLVITAAASRTSNRHITLGRNRVAPTSVLPSRGDWSGLPPRLLVTDFAALRGELLRSPPRLVRPRIDTEAVRALAVGSVGPIGYAPGDQLLTATLSDMDGSEVTVLARYAAERPGALDALATALAGPVRYLAGTVRAGSGGVLIEPTAVVTEDTVTVPDLAAPNPVPLAEPPVRPPNPATSAVDLLAELAHRGLRHLPAGTPDRLTRAAAELTAAGLPRCATALRTLAARLSPDPGEPAATAWFDAMIRLSTLADRH